MKIRQAKKIMNYYKRFYGSKYWLWRWGYYCGMKSIGKNAGDHRITKAISLTSKKKKTMKNETFDFSEALRRMKEGKNVRRKNSEYIFAICGGGCFPQTISYRTCMSNMFSLGVAAIPTECILATDWEEVEG